MILHICNAFTRHISAIVKISVHKTNLHDVSYIDVKI